MLHFFDYLIGFQIHSLLNSQEKNAFFWYCTMILSIQKWIAEQFGRKNISATALSQQFPFLLILLVILLSFSNIFVKASQAY
jgi:hypothetical protein